MDSNYSLSKRDLRIITSLENICKNHISNGQTKFIAGIIHKDIIISIGGNNYNRTNKLQQKFKCDLVKNYIHAETDAIQKALKIGNKELLNKCNIYIVRLNEKNDRYICKPCLGCSNCISYFNLRRTIYYDGDKYIKI